MDDKSWLKDIACSNTQFQTYECYYHITLPWLCKYPWEDDSMKEPTTVSIDKCLLPEILGLWEMDIKTTACCCGHGKQGVFIGVDCWANNETMVDWIARQGQKIYKVWQETDALD